MGFNLECLSSPIEFWAIVPMFLLRNPELPKCLELCDIKIIHGLFFAQVVVWNTFMGDHDSWWYSVSIGAVS